MNTLTLALKHFKSYTKIGAVCGVSRQAVQGWERSGRIPAEHCVTLERASGGAVTRIALMPELFGALSAERDSALSAERDSALNAENDTTTPTPSERAHG